MYNNINRKRIYGKCCLPYLKENNLGRPVFLFYKGDVPKIQACVDEFNLSENNKGPETSECIYIRNQYKYYIQT